MNEDAARRMAIDLMCDHGLWGWEFDFCRAKRTFGWCDYNTRTIALSRILTRMNDEATVRNTVLHEIAHALAGPDAGHGPAWKAKARSIGCDGNRCYNEAEVMAPAKAWVGSCPGCGMKTFRDRLTEKARTRISCKACSGGSFNARYRFVWKKNPFAG